MLNSAQVAFLETSRSTDEARPSLHHIGAKVGRAFTSDGHTARIISHTFGAAEGLTDEYRAVSADLKPVATEAQPPDIDRLAEPPHKSFVVELTRDVVDELLLICASAKGINKRHEQAWRKQPKKVRATSVAPNAGVIIRGGEYGLDVEIQSRTDKPSLRTRLSEKWSQPFSVCFYADYLADALEDLGFLFIDSIEMIVEPEEQWNPVFFRLSSAPARENFVALVMPRRM